MMAIACVLASLLSTETGTTAPFSAMSGAVIWISLLSIELPPPSAFTVSAKLLVLNAALFHSCASASPGLTKPAAAASASTPAPPPAFNTSRRLLSTESSWRISMFQSGNFTSPPISTEPREPAPIHGAKDRELFNGELHPAQRPRGRSVDRRIGDAAAVAERPHRRRERHHARGTATARRQHLALAVPGRTHRRCRRLVVACATCIHATQRVSVAARSARRCAGRLRHRARRRLHERARRVRDQP